MYPWAASGIGLFALTFGLTEANAYGWSSGRILSAFAVAGLTAFVALELRQRVPALDLSLFRNRGFSGASATIFFIGFGLLGTMFYVSLYMQSVLGYSPVETGAIPHVVCEAVKDDRLVEDLIEGCPDPTQFHPARMPHRSVVGTHSSRQLSRFPRAKGVHEVDNAVSDARCGPW
jgi:hypothetical protein